MGSKFLKYIRYNLVYFIFISFIFLAYFYMFDYTFHTKYKIENLKKNNNHDKCYITNNDLANNSQTSKETDSDETRDFEDFLKANCKENGNFSTYNTVYEFNDVIEYRFKKLFLNLFDTKLFFPQITSITISYNLPFYSSKLIKNEVCYILERKLRI